MTCKFARILLSAECPPLVFNNAIDSWPARAWSPDSLSCVLGNKVFDCRISPRNIQDVLWEADCVHMSATLSEVAEWMKGKPSEDNPLQNFSPTEFSCYVDYKYMKDMFADHVAELKAVTWETFGLDGRDGAESTIWIGSTGASTPCHYDTYGYNMVAQIYGRKRWHLFPPSDTDGMYATRIPYEESSVFSGVNVKQPDFVKHPLFQNCSPVVITLEPGQVLFVPRHWWHYVECVEPAVSINTWVEMPEDDSSRYHEALTRILFSGLASTIGDNCEHWLNPTEEIMPMEVNLCYLETALHCISQPHSKDETKSEDAATSSFHSNNLYKLAATFQDYSVKRLQMQCIEHSCNRTNTDITNSDKDQNILTGETVCHMKEQTDQKSPRKNQDGGICEKRRKDQDGVSCSDEFFCVKQRKLNDGDVCSRTTKDGGESKARVTPNSCDNSAGLIPKGDNSLQTHCDQMEGANNEQLISKESSSLEKPEIEIFALYPCSCCSKYKSLDKLHSSGRINTEKVERTSPSCDGDSPQTSQRTECAHKPCETDPDSKETTVSERLWTSAQKTLASTDTAIFDKDAVLLDKTNELSVDSKKEAGSENMISDKKIKFRDLLMKCILDPMVINVLGNVLKEHFP